MGIPGRSVYVGYALGHCQYHNHTISGDQDIHIVNNGSPVLQVGRDLVHQFLSVGGVGPLVRVVAD